MNKIESTSLDLEKLNVEKVKELFPNVVTEGKIDFDKLKIILGDQVDDRVEKYQFTWNGKSSTIKLAQSPSTGTLIPSKDDSKNWDKTGNLYIEGDNLEVLKQLQKTYYGKIKIIYIDPPYNTGGDFVYRDDFKDNIQNYKEQTKQTSRANPETNGRYHTDWLNMMYSRLLLSKNLLIDDGIIFISIDENEMRNLQIICDEIFGEHNKIGVIVWKNRTTPNDAAYNFAQTHEYVFIYAKNSDKIQFKGILKDISNYKNPDKDPNGPWIKDNPSAASGSEKDRFAIINPYTSEEYFPPTGRYWAFSQKRVSEWYKSGKLVFSNEKGKNFTLKKYLNEIKSEKKPIGSLYDETLTMHGTKEFRSLFFDIADAFKYPKPSAFIKYLIEQIPGSDLIVLDFFSGSATTAHAVMKLNAEDGGNRKFIMVQLPELIDETTKAYTEGYKNICEIGKERIRRAGDQIKQDLIEKKNKAGLLDDKIVDPEIFDNGFKVFKLESTNIIPWDGTIKFDEDTIFSQTEVIKEDRTSLDVLFEIMLKYGVFDKPVEEIKVNGKTMYSIAKGYLIVCLDNNISLEDVKEIGRLKPRNVIFKDSGFLNDNEKINAVYTLEKLGVEEIKSI
ncbi:adenine-specific DNA-methyltransferase [Acholeplasma morum]|uniref:site-specific DNA-methyltransferase n=1 Tax=Paracholeplasma morum TaxID=264637 RepID=UPI00195F2297|nr:site-specific DNA-methyltransferase [Paracholeplasma morum]MBM7453363.1 adenine-specific DNA-methyltransferase [Paracholeplasma morum]